jgi:biotin-dependent carboxylase-like uncharacterized protein
MRILQPGITLIEDSGRFGYQAFGMATAGACDPYAYRLGNVLVGNRGGEASLEFTLMGPTIEFEEVVTFALTGGDFTPTLNDLPVPLWHSCKAVPGDTLALGGVVSGRIGYLAVAGGIDVPVVMGSRSTYLRGRIGGLDGRALRKGDILPVGTGGAGTPGRQLDDAYMPLYPTEITATVVLGPQDDWFTEHGIAAFLGNAYEVTNSSDRMGYRLQGETIQHVKGTDIISDGIPLGAVQVTGDDQPIIMLADHQTTGGYTKIATVVTPDITKVAQASLGSLIRFKAVSVREANEEYRRYEERMRQVCWHLEE